jgi:hypothetical protein
VLAVFRESCPDRVRADASLIIQIKKAAFRLNDPKTKD